MGYGRLEITDPDGSRREFELLKATVRIGRAQDNDLVLVDKSASRRHADITYHDERGCEILNLSTTSEIKVDGVRIGEGQSQPLADGSEIVLGETTMAIRLESIPSAPGATTTASDTKSAPIPEVQAVVPLPPPRSLVPPPIEPEPLHMRLSTTDVAVEPGKSASLAVTVENLSDRVVDVTLFVEGEGIGPDWYTVAPPSKTLYRSDAGADSRCTFEVCIHPPQAPSSSEGRRHCRVVARAEKQFHDHPAGAMVNLTVLPYIDFEAAFSGKKRERRGIRRASYHFDVENRSNTPVTFIFRGEDSEDFVHEFDPPEATIAPGPQQKRRVRGDVDFERRWPFGRTSKLKFTTTVVPLVAGAQPKPLEGTLTQTLLPPWLLLLPLLLLGLLGLLLRPQQPVAAPPPDMRQTIAIQRGPVVRTVEVPGYVLPVEVVKLGFERSGVVTRVNVRPGDTVISGTVVAELRQLDQLRAIRTAEDELDRARRELENARAQHAHDVEQAQLDLAQEQQAAQRLQPGGPDDPARQAQQSLAAAQQTATTVAASGSAAKLAAQDALTKAAELLQEAQQRYSKAKWALEWVERHGTDPNSATTETEGTSGGTTTTTKQKPAKLNEVQKQAFRDAVATAEREVSAAERAVQAATRELDQARQKEILQNQQSESAVAEAQRKLNVLAKAGGNPALAEAELAVEKAQLKLDMAGDASFEPQLKAIDEAQRKVDAERSKYLLGYIRAPGPGMVIAVSISVGDSVQEAAPVIQLAVPEKLEIGAELNADQAAHLIVGSKAEVKLLTGPRLTTTATVRQIALPPAASDAGQSQSRIVRFQVPNAITLTLNTSAQVVIEVERSKDSAFWLPPPFVGQEGDRRYIMLCELRVGATPSPTAGGAQTILGCQGTERRLDVKVGIETPDQVEITGTFDGEQINEGMLIIGPAAPA